MQFGKFVNQTGTKISYSRSEGKEVDEYNLTISTTSGKKLADQIVEIREAFECFLTQHKLQQKNTLFQRIFVSDISNQAAELQAISFCTAVSYIQQPPLNGSKILTWIVLLKDVNSNPIKKRIGKNEIVFSHNGYLHGFLTQMNYPQLGDSYLQTKAIFNDYIGWLKKEKLSLTENCLRTWIYVRDIDNNYSGMVKARNEVFANEGLTPDTHFIASTGIEGQTSEISALVMIDAYSIGGLEDGQISYLKALEKLNPTHEYGVAFERGTAIDYGDRRHIFISGTASIDCKGDILHPNDIEKQTERVFENIKALLLCAEADIDDVNSMIIYLRDRADTHFVEEFLSINYPKIPTLLVLGPVCRSGWLIEIECTAIKSTDKPSFRNF